jgi:hypothetical protein
MPATVTRTSARDRLLERAGGALRVGQVARRLGISTNAVHTRRERGALLALPTPGEFLYPARQFSGSRNLPHLRRLFALVREEPDPWIKLSRLLEPSAAFDGESSLDLLEAGRVEDALTALRHGA